MTHKRGNHAVCGRQAGRIVALVIGLLATLSGCGASPVRPAAVVDAVAGDAGATRPASPPQQRLVLPAQSVVDDALALTGTRYRYGGADPASGFDCSGLVWYVYGRHGIRLPRVAARMASTLPEVDRDALRVGDLLFFKTRGSRWSHVAIYIGNDRFVHAPSARTGRVVVSSLGRSYWRRRLTGVRRPLSLAAS